MDIGVGRRVLRIGDPGRVQVRGVRRTLFGDVRGLGHGCGSSSGVSVGVSAGTSGSPSRDDVSYPERAARIPSSLSASSVCQETDPSSWATGLGTNFGPILATVPSGYSTRAPPSATE